MAETDCSTKSKMGFSAETKSDTKIQLTCTFSISIQEFLYLC